MQKLKNLIRYPLDIRRAAKLLSNNKSVSTPKLALRPIAIDLHTDQMLIDLGRHIACITHQARVAGSPVVIRSSRQILAGIARKPYGRQALVDPAVRWIPETESLNTEALVLTDQPGSHQLGSVQMLIGRDVADGTPVMPFPMHPSTLEFATDEKLAQLRANTLRQGVLFAGNQKASYANAQLEEDFSVMSRPKVLRTIHDHFGDRIAHTLNKDDSVVPITLRDKQQAPIASKNWLPTLSMYNFFICPPGANQPMCHNVIEAMSVGTIPILEYADRFHPALTDDVNAICFQGSLGLVEAINRIDGMSSERISELRQNVIEYYENHLDGVGFLTELRDNSTANAVSMPFHNKNLYQPTEQTKQHRSAA